MSYIENWKAFCLKVRGQRNYSTLSFSARANHGSVSSCMLKRADKATSMLHCPVIQSEQQVEKVLLTAFMFLQETMCL